MFNNNFKKHKTSGKKPRYLRYDDIFLSQTQNSKKSNNAKNSHFGFQDQYQNNKPSVQIYHKEEEDFIDDDNEINDEFSEIDDLFWQKQHNFNNFSKNPKILNEKIIKYKKRHLPTLQRYPAEKQRHLYTNVPTSAYWLDQDEHRHKKRQEISIMKIMWQKFFVTFAAILALIFLTWFIYTILHQNNIAQITAPVIIEPEQSAFKILPENPGGINIPHQDKSVYERVSPKAKYAQKEKLLPPEETPILLNNETEEYSIINEKKYYIKLCAGKPCSILQTEIELLKKKFSGFVSNKNCSIKKVSNAIGEQKHAILIGPFSSKTYATDLAHSLGTDCSVITVKE